MSALDSFMAWYGKQGSTNPGIALILMPVAVTLVLLKACWLTLKGDKRGKEVTKKVI